MSRIFVLTSSQFEGEVTFTVNDLGRVTSFDTASAKLTVAQLNYLLSSLPRDITEIEKLLTYKTTATLTEINRDITFEMFWDRYNEKIRSSRKRAQSKWNKMPKSEQIRAYNFISKYEAHIIPGTGKKYAETYLNAELWNN